MIKKIGILALVATLVASMTVASVMACTTRTPGYWKNHPDAWQTETIIFGGGDLTKAEAMAILWTPPRGDARIILAQKFIAGELSMLADGGFAGHWDNPEYFPGTDTFWDLMVAAYYWLEDHTSPVGPGSSGRAEGLALAADIDYWLNYYDLD